MPGPASGIVAVATQALEPYAEDAIFRSVSAKSNI